MTKCVRDILCILIETFECEHTNKQTTVRWVCAVNDMCVHRNTKIYYICAHLIACNSVAANQHITYSLMAKNSPLQYGWSGLNLWARVEFINRHFFAHAKNLLQIKSRTTVYVHKLLYMHMVQIDTNWVIRLSISECNFPWTGFAWFPFSIDNKITKCF